MFYCRFEDSNVYGNQSLLI